MNDRVNVRIAAHKGLAFIGIGFVRLSDKSILDLLLPLLVLAISRIELLDGDLIAEALRKNTETIFIEEHVGWVFRYRYTEPTLPEKLRRAIPRALRNGTSRLAIHS